MTPFKKNQVALEKETRRAGLIGLANEATVGTDGWVRLASYGDHPLQREVLAADGVACVETYLQRVTQATATALANEHNSFFGRLRKLRRGAPIKRGHSDRWDVAAEEGVTLPVARPAALENANLGVFARLEARPDGLYGLPIFLDAAQTAIERDRLKYFSPFWWLNHVGLENGAMVVEPYELISVALTASPNLKDSPALANASATEQTKPNAHTNMKKKLIGLLAKCQIALANEEDATIEAALPQLESLLDQRLALANEKATTTTALTQEQTAHGKTRTALENETTAAHDLAISLAIAEGRIAPSERAACLGKLNAGGPAARTALLNEAPRFKVAAETTATRRPEATATTSAEAAKKAAKRLVALGNELFSKGGYDSPEEAYAAGKQTEEGRRLAVTLAAQKQTREEQE